MSLRRSEPKRRRAARQPPEHSTGLPNLGTGKAVGLVFCAASWAVLAGVQFSLLRRYGLSADPAVETKLQSLERQLEAEQKQRQYVEKALHAVGGAGVSETPEVHALRAEVAALRARAGAAARAGLPSPQAQKTHYYYYKKKDAPLPSVPTPPARPWQPPITEQHLRELAAADATAVVIVVHKRHEYLLKAMETMLAAPRDSARFPIIVSQDGRVPKMTETVQNSYVNPGLVFHMHHDQEASAEDVARKLVNPTEKKKNEKSQKAAARRIMNYVYIAQHYRFAMEKVFDQWGFSQMIFLEEDISIAPDFFAFFNATLPFLKSDPKLFCVSAWNDNGHATLVSDPRRLYRSDFFPGLGWMLPKRVWLEVKDRWSDAYWDEFMRRPDVRQDRHCIRPEVSRSFTFGEKGVSSGQFYKQHLSKIRLNDELINWPAEDLSYLASEEAFDAWLLEELKAATSVPVNQVGKSALPAAARVLYDDKNQYAPLAKTFGLMQDQKEGIRRTSYKGVIPFAWKGSRVLLHTSSWPGSL